jgi:hypothetical protein
MKKGKQQNNKINNSLEEEKFRETTEEISLSRSKPRDKIVMMILTFETS